MANSADIYMSKGLDRKAADYFAGGRKRVVGVIPHDDFTLTLTFDNGEKRLYDMRQKLLEGTVFEPLIRPENFRRVYVDDTHCIAWNIASEINSEQEWSNKIDICADACYLDSLPLGEQFNN